MSCKVCHDGIAPFLIQSPSGCSEITWSTWHPEHELQTGNVYAQSSQLLKNIKYHNFGWVVSRQRWFGENCMSSGETHRKQSLFKNTERMSSIIGTSLRAFLVVVSVEHDDHWNCIYSTCYRFLCVSWCWCYLGSWPVQMAQISEIYLAFKQLCEEKTGKSVHWDVLKGTLFPMTF